LNEKATDAALGADAEVDFDPDVESAAEDDDLALPWRDRVVARSLGPAKRQSLGRAEAAMKATIALLESGENVTVQDVADNAGFSLRVLYRHFRSKEDLLIAVLESETETLTNRMRRRLDKIGDPIERLAEFIGYSMIVEPSPMSLALARQETALLLTHPAGVVRAQGPMVALARELVQAAVDSGRINPEVADHGVYVIMAIKRSYNLSRLLGEDFGLPLPTKDQLVHSCLRVLGVEQSVATRPPAKSTARRKA
jgi:AcrR family transcriptional regulator